MFALRYAHLYYLDDSYPNYGRDWGLDFPDEKSQIIGTFYTLLVLGMTFQVSDVEITSRHLRRLATIHGVLSFFFSTAILALSINDCWHNIISYSDQSDRILCFKTKSSW
jgi:uncharacterized membrane protein